MLSNILEKLQLKSSASSEIVLMDYVMSALDGFNGEKYVPGSFPCANNTRFFERDTTHMITNY